MAARWFKREDSDRSGGQPLDPGLTMAEYLRLDAVAYHRLLASGSTSRPLFGRRGGLLDYDSYLRLRRWIEGAAARAGVTAEEWATRAVAQAPPSPWKRLVGRPDVVVEPVAPPSSDQLPLGDPSDPRGAGGADRAPSGDDLIDRLERLTALRDAGALTEDEFQAQKRRLLDDGS